MTRDSLPPVFVISLAREALRRQHVQAHLAALGIDFEWVEALDAQELCLDQDARYSEQLARSRLGRPLVPAEIGCALSHLQVLQRVVDRDLDEALILEDDAVLSRGALEVLDNRERLPSDWDVVLLAHQADRGPSSHGARASVWGRCVVTDRYAAVRFVEHAWLALAYLVRRRGAQRLLDVAFPLWCPIDQLTGARQPAAINLFGIRPVCVTAGNFPSTMLDRHAAQLNKRFPERGPARKTFSEIAGRLGYGQLKRQASLLGRSLLPPGLS